MTENEAKKGLLFLKEKLYNGIFKDNLGCIDKAIQALEENQQYRAIGLTPSMVQDLIKSCRKHEKNALENAHIVDEYRAIGTVEEFKALKEKNTPMELDEHNFQDEPHHYLCPSCRCIVSYTQNYCEWCGQALET